MVTMPAKRRTSKSRDLSLWQIWSLTCGDSVFPGEFDSDEDRRAAWERHRDELLTESRGRRPAAWWDYDAEIERPKDRDLETPVLYDAGLLSEAEIAELMPQWREHYDKAQEPGFEYCIGTAKPGDTFASWIKGPAAKRAHYRWAGIPREIIKRFNAERKKGVARDA
jgi:hypothetical protein